MTISLCGAPGSSAGRVRRSLLRLAPDGVWRAGRVATAAGGLLPHLFTLTGPVARRPAVSFLFHFPSAFAASWPRGEPTKRPASCPAVSGLSSSPPTGVERARGHPACTTDGNAISAIRSSLSARIVLHSGHAIAPRTCRTNSPQTRHSRLDAAHERRELLVERAVERSDGHLSPLPRLLNTPVTFRGSRRARGRAARARRSRAGGGSGRRAPGGRS